MLLIQLKHRFVRLCRSLLCWAIRRSISGLSSCIFFIDLKLKTVNGAMAQVIATENRIIATP